MSTLKEKLDGRNALVGVIGLGYVGLPLAVAFGEAGYSVLGFEVDEDKVTALKSGTSYIPDVNSSRVSSLLDAKRLDATVDFSRLSECDAISVCVPTPLRKTRDPDLTYIIKATEQIAQHLRAGQLVVLESTTYPGTTMEIVAPKLAVSGFEVGRDVHLAFSPERIDPGNETFTVENTPKIIGGVSPACTEAAGALYSAIVNSVIPVSSPTAAEMVKLLENTFRAVNIGLVNEIAIIADKLKLDVWEIIEAAASKPFGFMPFYPGPGLGGHCIPIDPHYLSWKLRTLNYRTRFIELADDINNHMPEYVVDKVGYALNEDRKPINGSKVLIMGVAYKRNITDWRESPAVPIIEKLIARGAEVSYQDDYVPELPLGSHGSGEVLTSSKLDYSALQSYDCVVIVTDHSYYDVEALVAYSQRIVDTRNLTGQYGRDDQKVIKL
ncbi:MAG: UDP-N-acetyl-D-glucosamine dehydrogenase [Myxococcales bacterium]|nr:UDP-N-acetyl-D-glucosamine dehydrogenase [Myxococcales bacterium]|tara:strand:+ start:430 stop:1746 length:1317 start_codon:yes stop_codon:yes gene_type:complete